MQNNDEGNDSYTLRLGYPDRADLLPLVGPLDAGWAGPASPWKLETVRGTAAGVTADLLAGTLDAAFVPPLALSRHGARLQALGGWGVASEGVSDLALLLSPQRLDMADGGSLSLYPSAEGSTAEDLVRLLLKPYYDITLNMQTQSEGGYDLKGMRLLFGDEAAREADSRPEGWVAEDMGVAWFVLTGLPTVWEILAAPRDLEEHKPGARTAIEEALQKSRQAAREQQSTLLESASERIGRDRERTKEFLARRRYNLAEREQKALAHFFTLAGRGE